MPKKLQPYLIGAVMLVLLSLIVSALVVATLSDPTIEPGSQTTAQIGDASASQTPIEQQFTLPIDPTSPACLDVTSYSTEDTGMVIGYFLLCDTMWVSAGPQSWYREGLHVGDELITMTFFKSPAGCDLSQDQARVDELLIAESAVNPDIDIFGPVRNLTFSDNTQIDAGGYIVITQDKGDAAAYAQTVDAILATAIDSGQFC